MPEADVTRAADGRTLAYAEWGNPEGFPVFSLHGTPGSRLGRHYDESAYVEAGARVITYDRPGYGESERHPGRHVVDCVEDVRALADHLGIDRFAVMGGSGGGPHALAVTARLPHRVTRATCIVGIVPYDTEDFDFLEGMDRTTSRSLDGQSRAKPCLRPNSNERRPKHSNALRPTLPR